MNRKLGRRSLDAISKFEHNAGISRTMQRSKLRLFRWQRLRKALPQVVSSVVEEEHRKDATLLAAVVLRIVVARRLEPSPFDEPDRSRRKQHIWL